MKITWTKLEPISIRIYMQILKCMIQIVNKSNISLDHSRKWGKHELNVKCWTNLKWGRRFQGQIHRYIHLCLVAQSCPTLCDPLNCSQPSVHRIFQARILEWVATSYSRGSSQPRGQTQVSCIAVRFFTCRAIGEA